MKPLLSVMTASLLLAACAPTQMAATPEVLDSPFARIELRPGTTRYVEVEYPGKLIQGTLKHFDALKIDFNDRDSFNQVRSPEAPAPWLTLAPPPLPEGLKVSLERASIMKRVTRTLNEDSGTTVEFIELVKVVYRLAAEPTAPTGPLDLISMELWVETSKTPVVLNLEVKP